MDSWIFGGNGVVAHLKNKPEKNRGFLDWIARQPCATCLNPGIDHDGEILVTPSHIKTRAAGGQDVGNTISQCIQCHHTLGKLGVTLFQKVYRVDLHVLAENYKNKWLQERGGIEGLDL